MNGKSSIIDISLNKPLFVILIVVAIGLRWPKTIQLTLNLMKAGNEVKSFILA